MATSSFRIADSYSTLDEVTEALLIAGLDSSNLIVGIDFTKSNEWRGATSFSGRSLHHTGDELNPYEQAITIIGKTLAVFGDGNMIPCYGFGDASTHDSDVFSFYPDDRFCNGYEEVLSRYEEILPHVQLAGPTSFAPIIEMASTIVEQSGGHYHVLLIIADGQVTRSVGTELGQLSPQEKKTVEAIAEASKYALSIILVGVGDERWETVKDFHDSIPARAFHNLQFVNFTEIMSKNDNPSRKEAEFALAALKEIPSQYKTIIELNILGSRKGSASERFPLPPPINSSSRMPFHRISFEQTTPTSTHEPSASFELDNQVMEALVHAGLESSNLIIGIDFTKSNEWKGATSFNRRSLHHIGDELNPYEQAITIIGRTFAVFNDNNVIPCYGFGDASTHDQDVFSFYPDDTFCNGSEEVLSRYKEILPHLQLAGPTSFAPIIEMATTIIEKSGGRYHVLLIIADGQVTRSVGTELGQLSPQEKMTVEAIVEASKFPLSIILVGVGDGPWDTVKDFYDNIPGRSFDNLQFVNFTEIMSKNEDPPGKEAEFASAALMKIPSQYMAAIELDLLGQTGNASERFPLPPPIYDGMSLSSLMLSFFTRFDESTPLSDESTPLSDQLTASSLMTLDSTSVAQSTSTSDEPSFSSSGPSVLTSVDQRAPISTPESAPSSDFDNQLCPICISDPKDMAFSCGHQTCCDCGKELELCPICRRPISIRIKLY